MKINIVDNTVVQLFMQDLPPDEVERRKKESNDDSNDVKSKFSIKLEFEDDCFFVIFDLRLLTRESKVITIIYKSRFVTDAVIDKEFIVSNFPYVNAPAICYPYLRAFISNLTLNSGYSPVMLPSINFAALRNKTIKNNKSYFDESLE